MNSLLENFRNRIPGRQPTSGEIITPVRHVAGKMMSSELREIRAAAKNYGSSDLREVLEAYNQRVTRLGLAGSGLEIIQIRTNYQADLATIVLNQLHLGANLANIIGEATDDVEKILAENDLRKRAEMALNLNHVVVDALRRKQRPSKAWHQLAGLDIFEPWKNMLFRLDELSPELRKEMRSLDKTVKKTRRSLTSGIQHLSNPRRDITEAAATYDNHLTTITELDRLRNQANSTSARIIATLGDGNKPITPLAREMINIRQEAADVAKRAAEAHDAQETMIRSAGLLFSDVLGAQLLVSADGAAHVARGSLEIGATTLPLLGLAGLSQAVEATSWWNAYMCTRIAELIAYTKPVLGDPKQVIDLIIADWKDSLDVILPPAIPAGQNDVIDQLPADSGEPPFNPNQAFEL